MADFRHIWQEYIPNDRNIFLNARNICALVSHTIKATPSNGRLIRWPTRLAWMFPMGCREDCADKPTMSLFSLYGLNNVFSEMFQSQNVYSDKWSALVLEHLFPERYLTIWYIIKHLKNCQDFEIKEGFFMKCRNILFLKKRDSIL